MADNDSGIAFVSGFLLGGVLGAAVGILLAPKSGAETRAGIVEQGDVWRERAEEMAAQINASIAPTVDVVRERMGMEPLAVAAEPAIEDGLAPAVGESVEGETDERLSDSDESPSATYAGESVEDETDEGVSDSDESPRTT